MKTSRAVAVACGLICLAGLGLAGQTTGPRVDFPVPETVYGPDLFRLYCATCHGRDAKGDGPVAPALKAPPPDLTTLSKRSGGVFPKTRVEALIGRGTGSPAHGSEEMPVWGPIFRALDPSDARVKVRIANLASYIEGIQQR